MPVFMPEEGGDEGQATMIVDDPILGLIEVPLEKGEETTSGALDYGDMLFGDTDFGAAYEASFDSPVESKVADVLEGQPFAGHEIRYETRLTRYLRVSAEEHITIMRAGDRLVMDHYADRVRKGTTVTEAEAAEILSWYDGDQELAPLRNYAGRGIYVVMD
ncbi:MAG TPA: hypothetical protein VIT68_03200 [Candidatus Gracilibacteria bacterium]